mmetsp:Transcript_11954/g.22012  ORF Transcript_11954/g.22012 Transcript_11954/m.22012 type:complete len:82 (+) Transcript_11954:247-492(+)
MIFPFLGLEKHEMFGFFFGGLRLLNNTEQSLCHHSRTNCFAMLNVVAFGILPGACGGRVNGGGPWPLMILCMSVTTASVIT